MLVDLFLISTSFFSFILGLGEIFVPKRNKKNIILFLILLIVSYFLFHSYLMHTNLIFKYPRLLITPTFTLGFLGPLTAKFFFLNLDEKKDESNFQIYLKYFPSILSIILLTPFVFRNLENDLALKNYGIIEIKEIPIHAKLAVVISAVSMFYFFCKPVLWIKNTITFKRALKYENFRIFLFLSIYTLLIIPLFLLLILILNKTLAHYVLSIGTGIFVCMIFLLKQKFPHYFITIKEELKIESKIRKSQISNLNIEEVKENLIFLLEKKKIYLNENLSLSILSKELNLSTHQLSEFLNTILETQFYNLIGKYRVEEAKNNIENNPHKTLLEIAYESGFNSKSNFNHIFKQFTGFTPTEYKKKCLNRSKKAT